MDFVQLMGIDMLASLRCTCSVPLLNTIVDGVAVSCQLKDMLLEFPQGPRTTDTGVVRGSSFASRVAVPHSATRDALWIFAHTSAAVPPANAAAGVNALVAPISTDELESLERGVGEHCEPLSQLLVACTATGPQVRVLTARTRYACERYLAAIIQYPMHSRPSSQRAYCFEGVLTTSFRSQLRLHSCSPVEMAWRAWARHYIIVVPLLSTSSPLSLHARPCVR